MARRKRPQKSSSQARLAPSRPLAEETVERDPARAVLAESDAGVVAEGLLRLWEQIACGDGPLSPGLENPQSGHA